MTTLHNDDAKPPVVAASNEPHETDKPANAGFPIVGVGASAGGLAAFEAFFSGMPADTDPGMAFVLVQHLAPNHKSLLSDLIQRHTRMPVLEVNDGVKVQPNCVYIIPPGRDMACLNGALHLLEPAEPHGHRLPIDFFFSSLARDQHEKGICVVLSGAGSDGAQGARAVKNEGGLVIVQTPESAEFDSMPQSAIATGIVDYTLTPAEMPAQIIAYVARAFTVRVQPTKAAAPQTEGALKKIFVLLRAQTSHDFSQYKSSTINRRIERRMAVHQIDVVGDYVKYLQQTPAEVDALFRDLLIGVTYFFRDPAAFLALEKEVIPRLFENKNAGSTIRVWSAGCSTGEEAYSLAILLQERMEALKQTYTVQLFATDIDSRAIATARTGLYPASIATAFSPERLARFFTVEADGSAYRVRKNIRDMVIFSVQDVIKDPPFSKLNLISCRNVLIYMDAELQKKLIPLFHYALAPGGVLFLGTSETIGGFVDRFSTLDQKAKLYRRKPDSNHAQRDALSFYPPMAARNTALPAVHRRSGGAVALSLRELTEQTILKHLALSGALVNSQSHILYLFGRTGMYLEPSPGETGINNIQKMAREGLQRALSAALHHAAETKEPARAQGVRVKTNGHYTTVNLTVRPVTAGAAETADSPLYLVVLEEAPEQSAPQAMPAALEPIASLASSGRATGTSSEEFDSLAARAEIARLTDELRNHKEYLQAAKEEQETSNEELKSSNEEMQSVNEELQSANEELETSKEEMQSINEELATVNTELQTKVTDLSRANNDMNNLLAGTDIGTIFVDHQQRILRYTPAATRIINLIPSDVGRPVAHTVSNLVGYDKLVADTQDVLTTLVPKVIDVQSTAGAWYTMRILPYRTVDNVIEGASITFVDITEMVHTRDALRKANELHRLAVVVRDAHDAITVQDLDGCTLAWNPGAVRIYGWNEAEALAMNVRDRIPQALRENALTILRQLGETEILEPYRTRRLTKGGAVIEVSVTSTALVNAAGQVYAIATTERALAAGAAPTTGITS